MAAHTVYRRECYALNIKIRVYFEVIRAENNIVQPALIAPSVSLFVYEPH